MMRVQGRGCAGGKAFATHEKNLSRMPPKFASRSLPMSIISSPKLIDTSVSEGVGPTTPTTCLWNYALFLSPRGHMFRKRRQRSFIVMHPPPEALSRKSSRSCWTSWEARRHSSMILCSSV